MSDAFLPFTRPTIDEETIAAVVEVLRSGWITSGPKVKAFEAQLTAYFAGRPTVALAHGTAALELGLRMAGVGAGDEVITTPLTWVATANVILQVGATPVFVDVDPRTRNIDLERIEAALTPRPRAILPVYLAGLPVDMDRLYAIAAQHGLRVIEDAAQAFGATWKGRRIGAFGDIACFSFHANKNITSAEGGCLVLPAEADVARCERMRLQGVRRFGEDGMDVDLLGGKSNLTDICAAIGLGQLKRLGEFTAKRRALASRYFERLDPTLGLELPIADFDHSNWHMFQVVLDPMRVALPRGEFMRAMRERGIGIGLHYPALHHFSLYRELGFGAGSFPHAERIGAGICTLPLFPAMTEADVERVCATIEAVLRPARNG